MDMIGYFLNLFIFNIFILASSQKQFFGFATGCDEIGHH
jgi:hypothetical protein